MNYETKRKITKPIAFSEVPLNKEITSVVCAVAVDRHG